MSKHKYVSRQEAAILMSCTVADVDRYIRLGLLARYRIRDRYIRLLRDDVEELASVDPELLRGA